MIIITEPLYGSSHCIHHSNSNSNRIQQKKLSTGCRNKSWCKVPLMRSRLGINLRPSTGPRPTDWKPLVYTSLTPIEAFAVSVKNVRQMPV